MPMTTMLTKLSSWLHNEESLVALRGLEVCQPRITRVVSFIIIPCFLRFSVILLLMSAFHDDPHVCLPSTWYLRK